MAEDSTIRDTGLDGATVEDPVARASSHQLAMDLHEEALDRAGRARAESDELDHLLRTEP